MHVNFACLPALFELGSREQDSVKLAPARSADPDPCSWLDGGGITRGQVSNATKSSGHALDAGGPAGRDTVLCKTVS
eukprot:1067282-Alexandrium_andersonii.AAC.1